VKDRSPFHELKHLSHKALANAFSKKHRIPVRNNTSLFAALVLACLLVASAMRRVLRRLSSGSGK
jgi:hypothetical protein